MSGKCREGRWREGDRVWEGVFLGCKGLQAEGRDLCWESTFGVSGGKLRVSLQD